MANKIFTIHIEMLALSTRERWKNKFSNLMRWCHSFRKLNVESTCVRVQQPESTLESENGNKNKSYSKQKVILLHSKKWNDATIFLLLECFFCNERRVNAADKIDAATKSTLNMILLKCSMFALTDRPYHIHLECHICYFIQLAFGFVRVQH